MESKHVRFVDRVEEHSTAVCFGSKDVLFKEKSAMVLPKTSALGEYGLMDTTIWFLFGSGGHSIRFERSYSQFDLKGQ